MTVDYCTLQEVKRYYGNTVGATEDVNIGELIPLCSREIDIYCRRRFYGVLETRYFDAEKDIYNGILYVDFDLASVSSLINGDGTSISSSAYVLYPSNWIPKYGIKLKASSTNNWTYITDPENAISVTGTWGYVNGTVPPEDIKLACIRLVRWRLAQRNAPFETVGLPDLGQVITPSPMPTDIARLLEPYIKFDISAV